MKKLLAATLSLLLLTGCNPIRKLNASTVLVHVKIQKGRRTGWGTCSGVYVEKNKILTASHCVGAYDEGIKIKEVWIGQENGNSAKAEIELISPERDLCLLHTNLRGIPIRIGHNVRQDEPLIVIGMPLGLKWCVTRGTVSQINFRMGDNPTRHFIISASILPGSSGGPCFNNRGELIGIIVRSTSMLGNLGSVGLGIVVSVEELHGFLGY